MRYIFNSLSWSKAGLQHTIWQPFGIPATSSFQHHVSLCLHGPFVIPHMSWAVSIITSFICCQWSFTPRPFHFTSSTLSPTMHPYSTNVFSSFSFHTRTLGSNFHDALHQLSGTHYRLWSYDLMALYKSVYHHYYYYYDIFCCWKAWNSCSRWVSVCVWLTVRASDVRLANASPSTRCCLNTWA